MAEEFRVAEEPQLATEYRIAKESRMAEAGKTKKKKHLLNPVVAEKAYGF